VIGFDGSFHGRSYGAINAAGNPSYVEGFGPRLPGYVNLTFGDHEALKAAAASPTAAAIIIEPVQGEGGARAVPDVCLRGLRELCDEHGLLLIYDEVQCGLGRTGRLFAYEWSGAEPDIMAVAKALGGGFPVGACLATAAAAQGMGVGAHGSTYGGNPLAMAVGLAALNLLTDEALLDHVRRISGYFVQQLEGLKARFPDVIVDIRGRGLLIGVKLIPSNRTFMQWARDRRLLVAGGGDNCIRLLPPLVITEDEAREAIAKLEATCEDARAHLQAAVAPPQPVA
jgi:acetylornithine/N-succinyldiaminopimelate aminotransferase